MNRHDLLIGNIVKNWINDAGIPHKDIATEIKISQASLSQMLNGHIAMPRKRLKYFISKFQPSVSDLEKVEKLLAKKISLNKDGSEDTAENSYRDNYIKIGIVHLSDMEKFIPSIHSIQDFVHTNKVRLYPIQLSTNSTYVIEQLIQNYYSFGIWVDKVTPNFQISKDFAFHCICKTLEPNDFALIKNRKTKEINFVKYTAESVPEDKNNSELRFVKFVNGFEIIPSEDISWSFPVVSVRLAFSRYGVK